MRTIDLDSFRRQSFRHAMKHALAQAADFGIDDFWSCDLRLLPAIRSAALAGAADRLGAAIDQARHHAARASMTEAARLLADRQRELAQLEIEAARFRAARAVPTVDVVVLQDGWGKPGRAKVIVAWIIKHNATADQVAERFQLAVSTSKKYLRTAKRSIAAV